MMFSLWVSILFYHKVFVYTPHMHMVLMYIPYVQKVWQHSFKSATYNTGVKWTPLMWYIVYF